jgi:glycosyltransferase involved in cell wall biosynthesis
MKPNRPHVTVLTYLPSPYQVELFNAVAEAGECDLSVIYLRKQEATPVASQWVLPEIRHSHEFADEVAFNEAATANRSSSSDLMVFNFYQHPVAKRLLDARVRSRKAWAFWGERPGVSGRGWLGKLFRRFKLAALHRSRAPIWGIGAWAVAAWQAEFGFERVYHDMPYFSDLSRFTNVAIETARRVDGKTRFLFSGSLIERKGCDLIATAFSRLSRENTDVELHWVGNGPMEGALRETLRGCEDCVTFHGFVAWDSLPAFYGRANVLLAPSRHDGWALVVPEGLASGLPVISTTKVGAAHELIRHGENGWLIAPDDGEGLYRAMQQSIGSSGTMREAALKSVVRHQLSDGVSRLNGAVASALL